MRAKALENYQGIFARDFGPFLKGKGSRTELLHGTVNNLPQVFNPEGGRLDRYSAQPFSRVAQLWRRRGLLAPRRPAAREAASPTGGRTASCSPRASTTRATKLSNEYLEARDGQLYNIRIQGPAVGTAWTGSARSRCCRSTRCSSSSWPMCGSTPSPPPSTTRRSSPTRDGKGRRASATVTIAASWPGHRDHGRRARLPRAARQVPEGGRWTRRPSRPSRWRPSGRPKENTVLANFRVMVSTSSQMINHSTFKSKGNQTATRRQAEETDRHVAHGLTLANERGEYVVGVGRSAPSWTRPRRAGRCRRAPASA